MHPDNNITIGGPFYNITSYKSGLPGSFGQSPFVFIRIMIDKTKL